MSRYNDPMKRLWNKVNISENGCWEWTGNTNHNGYGDFTVGYKHFRVHRFVYEVFVDSIKEGMTIDHLCSNRVCVNPEHLEQVTRGENTNRGRLNNIAARIKNKTHCNYGHELTEENVFRWKSTNYTRSCKKCSRTNGLMFYYKYKLQGRI